MIIGVCGKKHSGKSTAMKILSQELGYEIISFSDKLKDIVVTLSGCKREDLEDYDFKENQLVPDYLNKFCGNDKTTYRAFIQHFGTEIMRNISDTIWIDSTLKNAPKNFITECRFINEANTIRKSGGIIIKIETLSDIIDNHQSETELELIKPNITICNTTTIYDFEDKIITIAKTIKSLD